MWHMYIKIFNLYHVCYILHNSMLYFNENKNIKYNLILSNVILSLCINISKCKEVQTRLNIEKKCNDSNTFAGQRYINDDPTLPERYYLPLETFTVKQNHYYRFRTVNAGFESAFEISVDDVRENTKHTYMFQKEISEY